MALDVSALLLAAEHAVHSAGMMRLAGAPDENGARLQLGNHE
jgi:hypothetical protein